MHYALGDDVVAENRWLWYWIDDETLLRAPDIGDPSRCSSSWTNLFLRSSAFSGSNTFFTTLLQKDPRSKVSSDEKHGELTVCNDITYRVAAEIVMEFEEDNNAE